MKKSGKAVTFLSLGVQHDQVMLKAAKSLTDARNHLLYAKGNLGAWREDAIQHINSAVDDIRAFEENGHHRRYGR
jgi:hypothetical protein